MVPLVKENFQRSLQATSDRHEAVKLMLDAVIAVITNGEKVLLIQRAPGIRESSGSGLFS
jgi:hypothetical protein